MTTTDRHITQQASEGSGPFINLRSWTILMLLCVAQFVNVFNNQSVQLTVPVLAHAFRFSTEGLQWVVNLNILAFGGGLLVAGRLADRFGHRRIFLCGLLLCILSLLVGGLALAQWMLLLARTLQGMSTALMVPAALALLTDSFPEGTYRNRALGIWGTAGQVGGITATLLGTLLVDHLGWPAVFFLNVPLVLVALLLTPRMLRHSPQPGERGPVDLVGAALVTCSLVLLMVGLTQLVHPAAHFLLLLVSFAGSLALFLLFCLLERHQRHPLVPMRVLRRPRLAASCLIQLVFATNATLFFFALYMQQVRGFSSFLTGLAFLPTNLTLIGGSLISARLIKRLGYKHSLLISLSLMTLSAVLLTGMSLTGAYLWTLLPGLLVVGLGHGITVTAITAAGMEHIPLAERGLASSLLNMSYQVGSAIGLAVLVTLVNMRSPLLAGGAHGSSADLIAGFHWAFYAQAAFEVLAILLTLLIMKKTSARTHPLSSG